MFEFRIWLAGGAVLLGVVAFVLGALSPVGWGLAPQWATYLVDGGALFLVLGAVVALLPYSPEVRYDFEPIGRRDLQLQSALVRQLLNEDPPPLRTLKEVHKLNPKTIWLARKVQVSGRGVRTTEVVGFFSLLPLKQAAIEALEGDTWSFSPDQVCKPKERPACLYIGSIAATGMRARGAILNYMLRRIEEAAEDGTALVYTRPISKDGLRLAQKYDFLPVNESCGAKELKRIYKRDFAEGHLNGSIHEEGGIERLVESAIEKSQSESFTRWAGGNQVTLALVFTDLVGSTALGQSLKDEQMESVRQAHFRKSRTLIERFRGYEIKTIGDSFMAAFRSVDDALDYARALRDDPGHEQLQVRAGLHVGPLRVDANDAFGGTVNFAARVAASIPGPDIWLSDRAKLDLLEAGAARHRQLDWSEQPNQTLKGFASPVTLWSMLERGRSTSA